MSSIDETKLTEILKRLDAAANEVRKAQGLQEKVESIQILADLVREQITHENSRHSARPIG